MFINILICDDCQEDLMALRQNIERFFFNLPDTYDYHIDSFSLGTELLKKYNENHYQIVFLDIEMPEINGLEVAKKLRENNNSLFIIFVSSYDQFMKDSFEVQPYQYLEKPIMFDSTKKVLQSIIKTLSNNQSSILTISTVDGDYLINLKELMYIQNIKGKKNYLEFHLQSGEIYITNGTIQSWENALKEYGFVPSMRGILVNIYHIKIIQSTQVILKNNESLPLSRRQAKIIHETFVNHVISLIK